MDLTVMWLMQCAPNFVPDPAAMGESVFVMMKQGISNMFNICLKIGGSCIVLKRVVAVCNCHCPYCDSILLESQWRRGVKPGDGWLKHGGPHVHWVLPTWMNLVAVRPVRCEANLCTSCNQTTYRLGGHKYCTSYSSSTSKWKWAGSGRSLFGAGYPSPKSRAST